jgi:hypothetical protein
MNLCLEHRPPRSKFKHHTRRLQASLIDMSDALFIEIFHLSLLLVYPIVIMKITDHLSTIT